MSPNSQYKIESSEVSIIQPSMTIDKITPLKGDDSTATTATMDDNDEKSPEKQQPIVTMTPVMSGTMPPEGDIIESPPQTPKEDGFDEFLSFLHDDDKSTPTGNKSSEEDATVEEDPPSKEEPPAKDIIDHDDDSVEKWEPLPTMEAKTPSKNGDQEDVVQDISDGKKSVEEDEPKSPQVSPNNDSIDEETLNNENSNNDIKEGNPSRRSSSELRNEMGTLLKSANTLVST